MLDLLKKNKRLLGAAAALVGLALGGGMVADKVELTEGQTEGVVAFVVMGGGVLLALGKAFLAKKAEPKDPAPPSA